MSEVQRFWSHEASNIRCVREADFDRVTAEREALQALLTAADERADVLGQALKFYAEREHYHFESGNWDTESGEPLNILWNGGEPDFIEDGGVARAALKQAEGGGDDLDDHDRSAQSYWADQAAQGKPYEQQLREACERNGIDHGLDTE